MVEQVLQHVRVSDGTGGGRPGRHVLRIVPGLVRVGTAGQTGSLFHGRLLQDRQLHKRSGPGLFELAGRLPHPRKGHPHRRSLLCTRVLHGQEGKNCHLVVSVHIHLFIYLFI